ncbi:hypothetical protein [Carboxylicivirga linearis]|uniref:O-antigen ligase domain-containing protein n=1 Tax=Carboxylicivirga linearis TaxID=1628157 RepID=A0ABS5K274_9BACT|nr:hypothetical protein [Carboxylicivirga linearis]MBS2100779.1 hypothetical protein [Carboxylicivirga linearis]
MHIIFNIDNRIKLINIAFWSIVYVLFLYAFEAPVRFYSGRVGLGVFIYTKDLVLLFLSLLFLFEYKENQIIISKLAIVFFAILIFFGLVATLNGISLKQVLFSYKIYLILFVGMQVFRFLPEFNLKIRKTINWLAFLSCLGIFINLFITFPWEGASMIIDGVELDTARAGYAVGGFKRVAGFGRNWSNPAYFALMATGLNYAYIEKWKISDVLLIIIFSSGILITTNKGAIGSFLLITLFFWGTKFLPNIILKSSIFLILVITVLFPILSWGSAINFENKSLITKILFASFKIRIEDMWPRGLELVRNHGSLLFGRGISGMGASQIIYEPLLYHPGDNVFVYLFGLSGMFSFVIFIYIALKIFFLQLSENKEALLVAILLICFLGIGLIGTALENGILNLFFGFMFAGIYKVKIRL